jgi:methyl coenzyme M reductase beta subunit
MKSTIVKDVLKKYKGKPLGENTINALVVDIQTSILNYLKSINASLGEALVGGSTERCIIWDDTKNLWSDIEEKLVLPDDLDKLCDYLETNDTKNTKEHPRIKKQQKNENNNNNNRV